MRPMIATLLALALAGCGTRTETQTTTSQQVDTRSFLLNAKDFDLQTVVGMVKSNKVGSAEALEKAINSDNGISNVDIDKDGKVDYISVKEGRKGDAVSLDLIAIPSGTQNPAEGVVIASITFSKDTQTNTVVVSGGYPQYVDGYAENYYTYRHPGLGFGEAMFLAWMFSPRPLYYQPYYYRSYYAPRPVYSHSVLTTRRTTYRAATGAPAISSSRRPSAYTIPSAKVPSRFQPAPRSAGSSFTERSGQGRGFQPRATVPNKPSSWGTQSAGTRSSGWGNSSGSGRSPGWGKASPGAPRSSGWGSSSGSSRSSGWGSSGGSKSSGWGRTSAPSAPSRSSGWGSSGGSRSSSWGSSSGSRSSGWGSSRSGSSFGGRRR